MTIDRHDAENALAEIDDVARRVRQSMFYQGSSIIMVLWGILVFIGYLLTYLRPPIAPYVWNAVHAVGVAGSILILTVQRRQSRDRAIDLRPLIAFVFFICFGLVWSCYLVQMGGRELSAFWASYFMLAYALVGLWAGKALVLVGLGIIVLTLTGYLFAGPAFDLWMAFANGGGLVLAGLWMRRA